MPPSGMGSTDQGLSESSGRYERSGLVCLQRHITKANYYYRLRRVRAACLEKLPEQMREHLVVPVEPELLQKSEHDNRNPEPGLDISIKGASIHVTEATPMPLFAAVLEVMQNA